MNYKENYQPNPSEIEEAEKLLDDTSFPNNPEMPSGKIRLRELTEIRQSSLKEGRRQILEGHEKEISNEIDPEQFRWVHSFISYEPLNFIRYALTSKVLDKTSDHGGFILWATEEMTKQAKLTKSVLERTGCSVLVKRLPSLKKERVNTEIAIKRGLEEMLNEENKSGENSIFNITAGAKQLKDAAITTLKSHKVPMVSISPNTTTLNHEFGTANINESDDIDTQWSKIGIQGLLELYGKKLMINRGGEEYIDGVWRKVAGDKRENQEENEFENEVKEEITKIPGCEFVAKNIHFHDPNSSEAYFEIDFLVIINGNISVIECKDIGKTTFKRNLEEATKSCGSKHFGGRFGKNYFVTKTPPKKLIENNPANGVPQAIKKARDNRILLVSLPELIKDLQKN